MQGNVVPLPKQDRAPTPDERKTAHAKLADDIRTAANLLEASGEIIGVMYDLLVRIHKDLIATSGSVSAETAEQLGELLSEMGGV